jgi:hypothetical protein
VAPAPRAGITPAAESTSTPPPATTHADRIGSALWPTRSPRPEGPTRPAHAPSPAARTGDTPSARSTSPREPTLLPAAPRLGRSSGRPDLSARHQPRANPTAIAGFGLILAEPQTRHIFTTFRNQVELLRCPGLRPAPVAPSGQPQNAGRRPRPATSRPRRFSRLALHRPGAAPYSPKARICAHFHQLLILNPSAHIDNDLSIAPRQAASVVLSPRRRVSSDVVSG